MEPSANLQDFLAAASPVDGDGVVWLDSSGRSEGEPAPKSKLFHTPADILEGSVFDAADRGRLRSVLAQLPRASGALAGVIDYHGRFVFGAYSDYLSGDSDLQTQTSPPPQTELAIHPEMSREDFCHAVRRAKEYIAAGDIYQVNLAQKFSGKGVPAAETLLLYQRLRGLSPVPRGAFVSLAGRTLLSASPETFLDVSGRRIVTRPIKGTRPRRNDASADFRSRIELLESEKERAELVMITDLERNDLGQVCEFGSVHVSELVELESFQQVYHLVSTVNGTLKPEVDAIDALSACYPGGSITGAPKKRAMEIIGELEPSVRGAYTGAIGYFAADGSASFNIAIRTIVVTRDEMSFHVGSGIVADSDPQAEYEETLHKGKGMALALGLDWEV